MHKLTTGPVSGLPAGSAAEPANDNAPLPAGIPPRWRSFLLTASWWHPKGFEAARMAYEAGFDLDSLASINLNGDPRIAYPVLVFQAENGSYHTVSPRGVVRSLQAGNPRGR